VIESQRSDPKRWIALVVLSSALFLIVLNSTILNVAVPTIIEEFHTNASRRTRDAIVQDAVTEAAGPAVAFAAIVVTIGALLSLLVPNIPPDAERLAEEERSAAAAA
jgi:MFS family permease